MQEIFYNGNIVTNNENNDVCEAMLINDGSVVFVGGNDEVLELKNKDTKTNDLNGKFVYPTLFDFNANVFNKIDNKIKNANHDKKIQNSSEIDENYDNFQDFETYKNEYLELEKEYIRNGVTTIIETKIDKREFAFWKKMSEDKLLKIDVLAYVDLVHSKQVMDDNCVTYRKYRNHFRLGGYYLRIDGKIHELKAWLKKSYTGTKSHYGSSEFYGEQLNFLIKTALDEKKQVLFDVNGDKAIEEVLTVFEEIENKDKITSFFRPIFFGASIVRKNIYSKLKHFDVTLLFENYDLKTHSYIKKYIGIFRQQYFHNYKDLIKNDVRFFCINRSYDIQNSDSAIIDFKNKKRKLYSKILKNNDFRLKYLKLLQKLIFINPSYVCFDQETRGSIETQKQASFMILNSDVFSENFTSAGSIDSVFVNGEK